MPWIPLLQFVAKAHEMSMQASMAAISLSYIRQELIGHGFVPFGAMFPATQITQLSSLWSAEFWATVSSKYFTKHRLLRFLIIVPLCIILAAGAGPASAISMIPRQMKYPVSSTLTIFNTTIDKIYPTFLGISGINSSCANIDEMDLMPYAACPGSGWKVVRDLIQRRNRGKSGTETFVTSTASVSNPYYSTNLVVNGTPYTSVATTEPILVVNALQRAVSTSVRYWGGRGSSILQRVFSDPTSIITKIKRPYVITNCFRENFYNASSPNKTEGSLILGELEESPIDFETYFSYYDVVNNSHSKDEHKILWVDPDERKKQNISLLVGILWNSPQNMYNVLTCDVKAWWIDQDFELSTGSSDGIATVSQISSKSSLKLNVNPPAYPVVSLSPHWAELLMPSSNRTQSADAWLLSITGDYAAMISALVALVMGNTGIIPRSKSLREDEDYYFQVARDASYSFDTIYKYDIGFDQTPFFFYNTLLDPKTKRKKFIAEKEFNMVSSDPPNNYPPVAFNLSSSLYLNGLAYSIDGTPIKLAITILSLYCILAICYACCSIAVGVSSTAWDSLSEITALAINSERTEVIRNTSTGIGTLETFQKPISIRARDGKGIQIVFENGLDSDGGGDYKKISVNEEY